jgi:hypothetical protein
MDARPTAVCIHPGLSLCSMCSCDIVSPQKRLVCDYSCSAPELSVKVPHNRYRASRGDGGGVVHELYVPQLTGSNKRGNVCRCQRLPSHIAASCRFSERSERCDELASNVLRRTCDETRHAARAWVLRPSVKFTNIKSHICRFERVIGNQACQGRRTSITPRLKQGRNSFRRVR